ncbi:MAG: metallophosphoesterase [Gorillibacterium sp.]|nr:metallophosphoesterase [Gorillibacterium sp.]
MLGKHLKIGIVSDTHMPERGQQLPQALIAGLQGVDRILHAGDWTSSYVVDLLSNLAPVDGVVGNNDGLELYHQFGKRKLLMIEGLRIGIIHGDGNKRTTEECARSAFADHEADLIIFGHSHSPWKQTSRGILMFNPGSPTDKRRQPRYSYGILELGETLRLEHYYYSDKSTKEELGK